MKLFTALAAILAFPADAFRLASYEGCGPFLIPKPEPNSKNNFVEDYFNFKASGCDGVDIGVKQKLIGDNYVLHFTNACSAGFDLNYEAGLLLEDEGSAESITYDTVKTPAKCNGNHYTLTWDLLAVQSNKVKREDANIIPFTLTEYTDDTYTIEGAAGRIARTPVYFTVRNTSGAKGFLVNQLVLAEKDNADSALVFWELVGDNNLANFLDFKMSVNGDGSVDFQFNLFLIDVDVEDYILYANVEICPLGVDEEWFDKCLTFEQIAENEAAAEAVAEAAAAAAEAAAAAAEAAATAAEAAATADASDFTVIGGEEYPTP